MRDDCAQSVGGGAGACVEALRPLVEELTELERVHAYLAWIKRINQLWSVTVVKGNTYTPSKMLNAFESTRIGSVTRVLMVQIQRFSVF